MLEKKYSRFLVITFIFILTLILYGNCIAQPWVEGPKDEMKKRFFELEDENGDGKVSRDEFKGPEPHWVFFDKNKDGFIEFSEGPTPDNMPSAPAPAGGGDGMPSSEVPADAKPLYGQAFMDKFDFDKDGKVSHDEWEGVKNFTYYKNNHWPDFNKNRDEYITLDEAPKKE